jgi:hypothetical protein
MAAAEGIVAAASNPLPVFVKNSLRFMESQFEPAVIRDSCGSSDKNTQKPTRALYAERKIAQVWK